MQSVSSQFTAYAQGDMRPLTWRLLISFDKTLDDNIDFFTIETSIIGGGDFIPSSGDVVQEWDKYVYADYSYRVISIEWERERLLYSSITSAMADIVLDNHDDYFTPNGGSEIEDYILPYRPIRLFAGFGNEAIPVFIGITEKMPVIDEKEKTASFHCIDFMSAILNRPINESTMFLDSRVDEILPTLFSLAGVSGVQLDIDEGVVTYPYIFFRKQTTLFDALNKLMEAEQGRIYMDEVGVIHFKNRQNYSNTSVYSFSTDDSIIDTKTLTEDDIYNVVEIKGERRELQTKQPYWQLPVAREIRAGETIDVWADFQDPVTSADDPIYGISTTTSTYVVNTAADGSGTENTTDVVLDNTSLFAETFKMTFTNNGSVTLYITSINIYATPVIVTNEIFVRERDEASIAKYDEKILMIENNFFQDETNAQSKALVILGDFADIGGLSELDVKGTPALQLDDTISVDIYGRTGDYKIMKTTNKIADGQYTQLLKVKQHTINSFFTIEVSLIGGEDLILP